MKKILIPNDFKKKMDEMMDDFPILYLYAQIGWGKTSVVTEYLKQCKITPLIVSGRELKFREQLEKTKIQTIVMDDFQDILPENEVFLKENLNDLLRKHRLLILSRAYLPAWLKPYQMIGQLGVMEGDALRFRSDELKDYLKMHGIGADDTDLYQIEHVFRGYPLALVSAVHWLSVGEIPMSDLKSRVYHDIIDYYDERLFGNWSRELYSFMLHMGGFDSFTPELASMVTGNPSVKDLLDEANRVGTFLYQHENSYEIEPFFREYLRTKQKKYLSDSVITTIYHNAGLYYELQDDYQNALKYYSLSKENNKIHDLLTRVANMHPGVGEYVEVEEYYRALPKEDILQSPALMCGMSMLCSMRMQVEESEYWYDELKKYCDTLKKTDLEYKYTYGKICWLDISLSHRGSAGTEKYLKEMLFLVQNKEVVVKEFSITSNLPSVLNGGKDFSCWYTKANLVYNMLKPVSTIAFGKGGYGLVDIGLAEKMFETADPDHYKILTLLSRGIDEAAAKGVLETQYAGIGILHRFYMAQGNQESAISILKDFRKLAEAKGRSQILANVEAELSNYYLRIGKNERAGAWMKEKAPNENEGFHMLKRYCYLAKVRCYIAQRKYMEGIALLDRLLQYADLCDRRMYRIEAKILLSIILNRMHDESWKTVLGEALLEAQEYEIIRTVADEGAALLPLLQEGSFDLDEDYKKKLFQYTREEALLHPMYLKNDSVDIDSLTASERQVLKLLGNGMKNKEIAEFLNISLNTVAYHTKNIYQKLGVNNRTQATNIAKTLE